MSLEQRQYIIELIHEARDNGARLSQACDCAEIDAATFRRWQKDGQVTGDKRPDAIKPAPSNSLTAEERQMLLEICNRPEFSSLPPSQIVPILADRGIYIASESSFYRELRRAEQQHDRGRAKQRQARAKPNEFVATGPNQCWTWDVTWLKSPVLGMFYYLYMVSDLFSRKVVAWEVHEIECSELAAQLIKRGVLAEGSPMGLTTLHADNGAIQKSATLKATLERMGILPSYSRPRVSNDNPFAESLFRTLKYRPDYPAHGFEDIASARLWALQFVEWYNFEHRHSQLNFVTPVQRHTAEDIPILEHRDQVYKQAQQQNPNRWSGKTRNWTRPASVTLNPDKPVDEKEEKLLEVI